MKISEHRYTTSIDKTIHIDYVFYCAGCKKMHRINNTWGFNQNFDRPTITPSIRVFQPANPELNKPEITLCHSFVTDGIIDYLGDSAAHQLRGKHELPDFEQWPKWMQEIFDK